MPLSFLPSTSLSSLPQHSTPPHPLLAPSQPPPPTISIVSTYTITPDRNSNLPNLPLSVSDLPMLSCQYIQKGLFFPPPPFPLTTLLPILTSSLSHALSLIPPLAGRLLTCPDNRIVISCNDAGVEFSYAVAPSLTLSSFLPPSTDIPQIMRSLFSLDGAISYQGHFKPLAAFQLTELSDGAVFLGATVNHAVVDGTSFWNFFNTWAALCRGDKTSLNPPDFTRNYFSDSKAVIRFASSSGPELTFDVNAPLRERFFNFSKAAIHDLKLRANQKTPTELSGKQMHDKNPTDDDYEISSFQSLCSHLWIAVTRARKRLSPTATTTLRMAVNCRHRVSPSLSPNYFGNAIQSIPTTVTIEDLLSEEFRWVAKQVNLNVRRHDDKAIRRGVEVWEEEPKCFPLGNFDGAGVTMGSSNRFPMYNGNDFGWGKPVAVRCGRANKFDGKMSAFPTRLGDGSIELEVCLEPEAMENLVNDEEFMRFVS